MVEAEVRSMFSLQTPAAGCGWLSGKQAPRNSVIKRHQQASSTVLCGLFICLEICFICFLFFRDVLEIYEI